MPPENTKKTNTSRMPDTASGQNGTENNDRSLGVLNSLLRISLLDIPLERQLELSIDRILSVPFLPVMPKGGIFLVEDEPEVLVMKAQRNLSESLLTLCAKVPFGKCLCGQAAKSRKLEFASHLDERHHIHYDGMEEHGHYNIPILSKKKVLGVIVLYLAKDHVKNKEEVDLLNAISDTIAGIIEHKRVEQKLVRTAETLAEAQRIARFGNWDWNILGNDLHWSDEIYSIFGLSKQKTNPTYETFINAVHPDDRDAINKAVENALSKKIPYSIDHRIILPDGTEKIVHEHAEVNFDKDGKPIRMLGTVQDITERKTAENKLLEFNNLLNALNQTQSHFITDAPPKVLFEKLLKELISLTQSEYGFISETIYTEDGSYYLKTRALTNVAWDSKTRKFYDDHASSGMEFHNMKTLFGTALTTASPVIANNPANDKRSGGLPKGHPPLNSFLGIPLFKGKKLVGVIGIANRPGGYDKEVIEYLMPLTNNCANIIEAYKNDDRRKMAEKALWEHTEEVTALAESSNIIGSIPFNENVYETICNVAVRQFKIRMAWVGLIDEESKKIQPAGHSGVEDGYLEGLTIKWDNSPEGMGPSGMAIKTKSAQVVFNIDSDPAYEPWRAAALKRGYHSSMAIPLIDSSSNVVGLLNFYSEAPRYFTKKRQHLLHVYANYVAVAIENRLLIEGLERKIRNRTSELEEYGYKLRKLYNLSFATGENIKEFTSTLLEGLAELLDVDGAAIGIISETEWKAYAAANRSDLGLEEGMRIPIDEVYCNIVSETQKPLMIKNAAESNEFRNHPDHIKHGIVSYLGVPVFIENTFFGVLCTFNRKPHEYREYDIVLHQLISMRLEFELVREKYINDLRGAMIQAKSANKAKSDFLANMSHELRTPLNSIIGFSEMMHDGMTGEINEKQKEFLGDVIGSSQHLLSLINDILDLSKIEAGKMTLELSVFDLKDMLNSSMDMFKHKTAIHNIKTSVVVADGIQSIVADERKIKQVIYNLLGNAMKFTPDNGSITITAKKVIEKQELPSEGTRSKGYEAVEISVLDTGKGIPKEHLKMLFKPFEQLVSPYLKKHEGTGLGLALCKQIVDLHGGRIYVESKVGKGSTFSFFIPLDPDQRTAKEKEGQYR